MRILASSSDAGMPSPIGAWGWLVRTDCRASLSRSPHSEQRRPLRPRLVNQRFQTEAPPTVLLPARAPSAAGEVNAGAGSGGTWAVTGYAVRGARLPSFWRSIATSKVAWAVVKRGHGEDPF